MNGNALYVGLILISVKLLIGYITVKIVMLVRDNGNTCVWQALFTAARSMSQTLTNYCVTMSRGSLSTSHWQLESVLSLKSP